MVQISPHSTWPSRIAGLLHFVRNDEPTPWPKFDLNTIKNGILHISVPLKAGEYEFPGLYKSAQVQIEPDTMAWLTVTLAQNHQSKTRISGANIVLSKPVVVNNPSTAYEENGNRFRDLFASVHIRGIEIDTEGRVLFQGYMRKGFSCNDLKQDFKPELFPRVTLELDSLFKKSDKESDESSIHDLLVKMGAVLGEAKCVLKLEANNSKTALHLKATLDSKGHMTLVQDPEYTSSLVYDEQQLTLTPKLAVSGVNMLRPKVSGDIAVNNEQLSATMHLERNKPTALKGDLKFKLKKSDLALGFALKISNIRKGEITYFVRHGSMPAFSRNLQYELFPGGRLSLKPLNSGIAQFLCPDTNFVASPGMLLTAARQPIDSIRLQEITQAPIRCDNRLKLLINGVSSMKERLKLIEGAQKSICLQTLIFRDDSSGMKIAQSLVDAQKRGVSVRVIVDSLGNIDRIEDILRKNKAFELMQQGGVDLQFFSNLTYQGLQKIIPVLGRYQVLNNVHTITELLEPTQILSTFNMIARAALGSINLGLSSEDKNELREGLRMLLGSNPETDQRIETLANISQEHPLQLYDLVKILGSTLDLNHRWHEKYFIVDGHRAILGGMNIADEYLEGGSGKLIKTSNKERPAWRDTDILIEGPAALDAYKHFGKNWKTLTDSDVAELEPLQPNDLDNSHNVQIVQTWPGHEPHHSITNLKVALINSLGPGDKAYEASAYFIPTGALSEYCEALKQAAQRGVDIRILTNSIESTDVSQVNRAALVTSYRDLLAAGIRIFEHKGSQTMHQKTAVYGSKISMIGSFNLDNRSASLNSECACVVHSQGFGKQVEDMILDDMNPQVAREIFLSDVQSSPVLEEIQNSAWAMLAELM